MAAVAVSDEVKDVVVVANVERAISVLWVLLRLMLLLQDTGQDVEKRMEVDLQAMIIVRAWLPFDRFRLSGGHVEGEQNDLLAVLLAPAI
jgi:hypothetical protein